MVKYLFIALQAFVIIKCFGQDERIKEDLKSGSTEFAIRKFQKDYNHAGDSHIVDDDNEKSHDSGFTTENFNAWISESDQNRGQRIFFEEYNHDSDKHSHFVNDNNQKHDTTKIYGHQNHGNEKIHENYNHAGDKYNPFFNDDNEKHQGSVDTTKNVYASKNDGGQNRSSGRLQKNYNDAGDKRRHFVTDIDEIHHSFVDTTENVYTSKISGDQKQGTVIQDNEQQHGSVVETTEKINLFKTDTPSNCDDTKKSEVDKSFTTLINYPFAVSIQRKGAHYATGALIDSRWILTCAAEFYNVRESIKLFRARLGSVDCKRGGILAPLTRVEIHPSYVYGEPNFDLSLLKMAYPVEFTDFIHPISLSNIRTKVISAKFFVTYWPRVIIKGQPLPSTAEERIKQNSMRASTQRLIPRSLCLVQIYENTNQSLHDASLCLKPFVSHHSPCLPDAGAPVVAEDGLWGITSGWTPENCLSAPSPSPTVFSRVSSLVVMAWLDSLLDLSSELKLL